MDFKEYMSVKRYGTTEVEGIDVGTCYIFPKIDGTNASVWNNEGKIEAGSRRRKLSLDSDNAGFFEWILDNPLAYPITELLLENKGLRLYGEWLVPHTLKTYRDDAWRRFYIFDVSVEDDDGVERLVPYDEYQRLLEAYQVDYLAPLGIVDNPSYESLVHYLDLNNFLIKDGKGAGEGIVVKNYDFINEFGRQTWAKIVRSEFKEKHHKEMGAPRREDHLVEEEIASEFVTQALCDKTLAKIKEDKGGWDSPMIPELLNRVFYDVVNEDAWEFVKKHKFPRIDFNRLRHFVYAEVKKHLPIIF